MITVEVRDLCVFGRHGVHGDERERGQDFVFDVELEVGERGTSDRLEEAARGQRGLDLGGSIQIARLLADPDRIRLAQRRDSHDLDSLLVTEGVHGRTQRALAVAEVGA